MDEQRTPAPAVQAKVFSLPQAPDTIELRHLRAFVAVAEELNFSRAAARLYTSQPSLSRQIRVLERAVGCDLLRRSTHRVELTLAGDALLTHARRLLVDLDNAITMTRSVGGEMAGRLARMWAPFVDYTSVAVHDIQDIWEFRAALEQVHAGFAPPPEIGIAPVNAAGVPSLLLTPPGEPRATILLFHGGGYISGSAFGYRHLGGALALATNCRVLLPEYRLAPENPYPAALEDAIRACAWLTRIGAQTDRVVVAGDSAGSGLAMSLLLALRAQDQPLPAATLLFCPWVDLRSRTVKSRGEDDAQLVISQNQALRFAAAYLDGHPSDDPLLNPLDTDLSGLPPMLVQAATGDSMLEDAHRLVEHARSGGIDAEIELYPVPTHDFHLFWSFLPEAADALEQSGRFLDRVLRTGTRRTAI
jgi:epsilon-lactone hydrolase